jgi:YD repeat-containing protein
VTTLTYSGGRVSQIADWTGHTETLAYNAAGQLTTVTGTDPDGPGPQAVPVWTYQYDSAGHMTLQTNPQGAWVAYTYNFAGMLESESYPSESGRTLSPVLAQGLVDLSQTGYDAAHLASVTLSTAVSATRTDQFDNSTTYTTDRFGNTLTETDALGHTTTYVRDDNGRITSMTAPGPNGLVTTQYQYDAHGNLTRATYDVGTAGETSESWTYDSTWNVVTSHTDRLGRVTTYTLNSLGLVASMTEAYGTADAATTTYTYTDGTGTYAALAKGLL